MSTNEPTIEQRTPAWHALRAGKITASRFVDVMAFSKRDGAPLKAHLDYQAELVCERMTGKSLGVPMNLYMQWGVDVEPTARAAYEAKYAIAVDTPGFIIMGNGFIGCSPDGLVNADDKMRVLDPAETADEAGGLEIKCPYSHAVHLKTWLEGMPDEHVPQVQGSMMVTGRRWWDFVSYHPDMPDRMRLYIQRIRRDDDYIAKLGVSCELLNDNVNGMIADLNKRLGITA